MYCLEYENGACSIDFEALGGWTRRQMSRPNLSRRIRFRLQP